MAQTQLCQANGPSPAQSNPEFHSIPIPKPVLSNLRDHTAFQGQPRKQKTNGHDQISPSPHTETLAYIYSHSPPTISFSHFSSPIWNQTRRRLCRRRFCRILKMKVIAAYLLAVLGGNTSPSSDDIKDILGSVGAEADDDRIDLLLSEVKGKDITELIAAGREKLASVPAGGGGGVALSAAPSAGGGGGAAAPADEPKKEEKVEEKEESDDDMGFSLFD
ncbi:hypothetical protein Droror1_Dr00004111 [Drosera rotundifolia]